MALFSWTEDKDNKLKNSEQMVVGKDGKDGKDRAAITALVPGRTERQCQNQCRSRWHNALNPSIEKDEDIPATKKPTHIREATPTSPMENDSRNGKLHTSLD
jgi:hypothetical protein